MRISVNSQVIGDRLLGHAVILYLNGDAIGSIAGGESKFIVQLKSLAVGTCDFVSAVVPLIGQISIRSTKCRSIISGQHTLFALTDCVRCDTRSGDAGSSQLNWSTGQSERLRISPIGKSQRGVILAECSSYTANVRGETGSRSGITDIFNLSRPDARICVTLANGVLTGFINNFGNRRLKIILSIDNRKRNRLIDFNGLVIVVSNCEFAGSFGRITRACSTFCGRCKFSRSS